MITIELKQVRFFAYHGLYPEERKTGNEFEVSLFVSYEEGDEMITQLDNSIDYASLFGLVKTQFDTPVDLLETLVINLAAAIRAAYPRIRHIRISVTKLHPPIPGFTGQAGIRFEKSY